MNRREFALALIAIPFAVRALDLGALTAAVKDPLIALLMNKLNINDNQAQGGVGSMLTLVKEKLSVKDFSTVTKLLPNAGQYMDTAKSLGAISGPVKNLAGLNGALSKLGMNADTTAKFVPTVTDFLSNAGGDKVKGLLAKALK